MIQNLPWSTKTVLLKINRRQFKSHHCQKVFIPILHEAALN